MTDSSLCVRSNTGLVKDFRSEVTVLENTLKSMADGVNIIAGTEEKPIVTDSELIPIRHFFMDGVYIREMTMRKDTAVIGAIHKHLHMCFLLTGKITVSNEDEVIDHIAPFFIVSTPGVKRVLYAHEDSIWYNTHKNYKNTEDIDELERDIVAVSYKEYEEYTKNK